MSINPQANRRGAKTPSETPPTELARAIQDGRIKKDWTTTELGEKIGDFSDAAVTQWEKGQTIPRRPTVESLERHLDIKLIDVWKRELERRKAEKKKRGKITNQLITDLPQTPEGELIDLYRQLIEAARKYFLEFGKLLKESETLPPLQRVARLKEWLKDTQDNLQQIAAELGQPAATIDNPKEVQKIGREFGDPPVPPLKDISESHVFERQPPKRAKRPKQPKQSRRKLPPTDY